MDWGVRIKGVGILPVLLSCMMYLNNTPKLLNDKSLTSLGMGHLSVVYMYRQYMFFFSIFEIYSRVIFRNGSVLNFVRNF